MTIKKIMLVLPLLAGAFTISSCTKEEHVQEYNIKSDCSGLVCSFSLEDDAIDRYINLLGKPKDKVIKRVLLNSAQDELTWSILGDGTFADNSQLEHRNLAPCTDDEDGCSLNSNPTGFVFESIGPEQIGVSGSITNDDGSITQIDKQSTIDVETGKPIVSIARGTDDTLAYTFTADPTDTGIPDGATYTWYVDNNEVGTGESIAYIFNAPSTLYQVKLVVSSPDLTDDIIVENDITSGYISPVINEPVINGKTVSVSADVNNTGLPSGTTYTWSVVGETVTATGTSATLELPAYATAYTITLTTTPPEGDELTSTKNITTGYGDIALSSESVLGSGTDYKFTADTSNTGLPETATFEWKIDGVTQTETTNVLDHDFVTLGSYEVSVQAKVDGNLVGSPVTAQLKIRDAGDPGIQVHQGSNNLEKVFTANLNTTGIDDSWTKSWKVNGNTIAGETGNSFTYQFPDPDTNYPVQFTATKDSQTKNATYNFTAPPINLDATTNLNISGVNASRTAAIKFLPAESGITDNWSFQWSSSDTSATFNAPTAKNTSVTFSVSGEQPTVTMTATSPGNTVVQVTSGNIYVPPAALANMDWIIRDLPSGKVGPFNEFPYAQSGNMVGISCPSGWSPVNNFGGSKIVSRNATPTATNESTNGSSIPANTTYAKRLHAWAMSGKGSAFIEDLSSSSTGVTTGGLSLKSDLHYVSGTPTNPFLQLICVSNSHGGPWSNTSI